MQSPFAALMRDGNQREKRTTLYHCDMQPSPEPELLQQKHLRADYDEPFPTIFGSVSK